MEKQTNLFDRKTKQTGNIKSQPVFFRVQTQKLSKTDLSPVCLFQRKIHELVVSTQLKNICQNGFLFPKLFLGENKKTFETTTYQHLPKGAVWTLRDGV